MLLAIDIGNSYIKIGLFANGADRPETARVRTHPERGASGYGEVLRGVIKERGIDATAPMGVVISSVVPGHTEDMKLAAEELTGREPLLVGPGALGGLRLDIKDPEGLGPDRIASAVAAAEILGTPVAVVDMGTATTVDFIGRGGVFKGGAIMPGLGMMSSALSRETAGLPEVGPKRPGSVFGKDTPGCILSGIVFGTAGAVERFIKEAEATEGQGYMVAATGGYLEYVKPWMRRVDAFEPDLTLLGLELIFRRSPYA
jgi:type III pantothenate kinase